MKRIMKRVQGAWRWTTAHDRAIAWLVFGLFVYYCATPGIFEGKASGDGLVDFLFLPATLLHHTFDMSRAVSESHFWTLPRMNGQMTNPMPIGPPLAWLPLYVVGLGLESLVRASARGAGWFRAT